MASTALNNEEIQEFEDSPEELRASIIELADIVRSAAHFIVYTGAGISTAAGVPDFRGPNGVWTRKAKSERGETVPQKAGRQEYTSMEVGKAQVVPTRSHMAIVELMNQDICKYLISSNCDGLHLASGVPPNKISEVHGNSYVEACSKCGRCYHRGYARVRTARNKELLTGRVCTSPACDGCLRYTTVAFNQSMPDIALDRGEDQAVRADVVLTLGTSMRVFPSCDLPLAGKATHGSRHKLVMVNLQKTPVDDDCAVRIFAKVDTVMEMLMAELGYDIPDWEGCCVIDNDDWREEFRRAWPFRSAGDEDWFRGPHVVLMDDESIKAHEWDIKLRMATGNRVYKTILTTIEAYRAGKREAADLARVFIKGTSLSGENCSGDLLPGLLDTFADSPRLQRQLQRAFTD